MARLRIAVPDELTLEFTCSNYERVNARALSFVRDAGKLQAKCSEASGISVGRCAG